MSACGGSDGDSSTVTTAADAPATTAADEVDPDASTVTAAIEWVTVEVTSTITAERYGQLEKDPPDTFAPLGIGTTATMTIDIRGCNGGDVCSATVNNDGAHGAAGNGDSLDLMGTVDLDKNGGTYTYSHIDEPGTECAGSLFFRNFQQLSLRLIDPADPETLVATYRAGTLPVLQETTTDAGILTTCLGESLTFELRGPAAGDEAAPSLPDIPELRAPPVAPSSTVAETAPGGAGGAVPPAEADACFVSLSRLNEVFGRSFTVSSPPIPIGGLTVCSYDVDAAGAELLVTVADETQPGSADFYDRLLGQGCRARPDLGPEVCQVVQMGGATAAARSGTTVVAVAAIFDGSQATADVAAALALELLEDATA